MKGNRRDLQAVTFVHHVKFGQGEIAVQNHLRGAILKNSALAVFQTQKVGREHRKAIMLPLNNAFGIAKTAVQILGLVLIKLLHASISFVACKRMAVRVTFVRRILAACLASCFIIAYLCARCKGLRQDFCRLLPPPFDKKPSRLRGGIGQTIFLPFENNLLEMHKSD
jgi:hypothetical protein